MTEDNQTAPTTGTEMPVITISDLRRTPQEELMRRANDGPVMLGQFREGQKDGLVVMRLAHVRELTDRAQGPAPAASEPRTQVVRRVFDASADPLVHNAEGGASFGALLAAMAEQTTRHIVGQWFEERLDDLRTRTDATLEHTDTRTRELLNEASDSFKEMIVATAERNTRMVEEAESKADATVRQAHEQAAEIVDVARKEARELTEQAREAALSCLTEMVRRNNENRQAVEETMQSAFGEMRALMENVRDTLRDERLAQIQETEARLRGVLGAATLILSSDDDRTLVAPAPAQVETPVEAPAPIEVPGEPVDAARDPAPAVSEETFAEADFAVPEETGMAQADFAPEAAFQPEAAPEPDIHPVSEPKQEEDSPSVNWLDPEAAGELPEEVLPQAMRPAEIMPRAEVPAPAPSPVAPVADPWADAPAELPAGDPWADEAGTAPAPAPSPAPRRSSFLDDL